MAAEASSMLSGKMEISHRMKEEQLEHVLTEFDATTSAIRGIEEKFERVNGYLNVMHGQHVHLGKQLSLASKAVGRITDQWSLAWLNVIDFSTDILDLLSDVVDASQDRFHGVGLRTVARDIVKEMWPVFLPTVLFLCLISGSNVTFGFLLADDEKLAHELTLQKTFFSDVVGDDLAEDIGLLRPFAIAHCSLVSLAVAFGLFEIIKYCGDRFSNEKDYVEKSISRIVATEPLATLGIEGELSSIAEAEAISPRQRSRQAARLRDMSEKLRSRRPEFLKQKVHKFGHISEMQSSRSSSRGDVVIDLTSL
eukprot:TRINITY_DN29858_c0_g1_i2.p1 TRINITY_DN29858_c0_g1~~TRINITY_DN29858_c0_g1_i2.p1  ORF type:complete len:324 (-),score=76.59 TRINITY_DN29858_c0_g1_i2:387-1313(-)